MFNDLQAPATLSSEIGRSAVAACARGSIDDAPRDRLALQARVCELEAANDGLRREVEFDARRLHTTLHELALAADRAGDRPLARLIRSYAALPSEGLRDGRCEARGDTAAACPGARTGQRLSARERQVLGLVSEGKRSPCIASHLGISVGTVEVHRRNIMRKLGLHTAVALTKYALREGLTSL